VYLIIYVYGAIGYCLLYDECENFTYFLNPQICQCITATSRTTFSHLIPHSQTDPPFFRLPCPLLFLSFGAYLPRDVSVLKLLYWLRILLVDSHFHIHIISKVLIASANTKIRLWDQKKGHVASRKKTLNWPSFAFVHFPSLTLDSFYLGRMPLGLVLWHRCRLRI
jgi:hypothetical protein